MKNIFKSLILIISAMVLFSSCRVCLTKRHYRKGYHMEFLAKKSHPRTDETKQALAAVPVKEKKVDPIPVEEMIAGTNKESPLQVKNETVAKKNKIHSILRAAKNIFPIPDHTSLFAKKRANDRNMTDFSTKDPTASDSDDARSWLWTIALAILIIWLVGVLFSSEWVAVSLINLLLLVAVIIFFLWLFRII
jgi:hypothetical protein